MENGMQMEFHLGGMVKRTRQESLPHHGMTLNVGANGTLIEAKVTSVMPKSGDMTFVVKLTPNTNVDDAILHKEGWRPNPN